MTFNWAEFLSLAETLQREHTTLGNGEACLRTAISRAYYAAYMIAANKAKAEKFTPSQKQHTEIRKYYINSPSLDRRRIGNWLQRLSDNREQADYRDIVTGIYNMVQASLEESRKVIDALSKL